MDGEPPPGYWNHNVQYQRLILAAVPPGRGHALDVGCGGDLLAGAAAMPADWLLRAIHGEGESGAPIVEPEMAWRQVRMAAHGLLPGARYRRHLLWRYSLVWRKPG